ncbi:MAG: hypothetical protein JNL79_28035, partial [Myxococcales bacterium]|nr:hypothetical protein [Myxococcales bacterium]
MVVLRRIAHEPVTGARWEIHELLHSQFRIRLTRTHGITYDEGLMFGPVSWDGPARPQVELTLRGHLRNTEGDAVRWIAPGVFAIGSSLESLYARLEPDTEVLSFDWQRGSLGTRVPVGLPLGSLSRRNLRALTACAAAFTTEGLGRETSTELVAQMLAILRAEGVPLDLVTAADLAEPVADWEHSVFAGLTRAMTSLDHNPMSVDLEETFGRSRRAVVDQVGKVAARFRLNGSDWRTLRNRFRVASALALSSHRDARTEDVARALGYGSPRALCNALARESLPSPQS